MNYEIVKTNDGSWTFLNKEYGETYHNIKDGALKEALFKHVKNGFELFDKDKLYILDICFGLGYNTLATIYYFKNQERVKEIFIYSPEKDINLFQMLQSFEYPDLLKPYKNILEILIKKGRISLNGIFIELFRGDALEYIKRFENFFDIIYQDPFSFKKNSELWSESFFDNLYNSLKENGVITTYSISKKIRERLKKCGFLVYEKEIEGLKKMSIATKKRKLSLKSV